MITACSSFSPIPGRLAEEKTLYPCESRVLSLWAAEPGGRTPRPQAAATDAREPKPTLAKERGRRSEGPPQRGAARRSGEEPLLLQRKAHQAGKDIAPSKVIFKQIFQRNVKTKETMPLVNWQPND